MFDDLTVEEFFFNVFVPGCRARAFANRAERGRSVMQALASQHRGFSCHRAGALSCSAARGLLPDQGGNRVPCVSKQGTAVLRDIRFTADPSPLEFGQLETPCQNWMFSSGLDGGRGFWKEEQRGEGPSPPPPSGRVPSTSLVPVMLAAVAQVM